MIARNVDEAGHIANVRVRLCRLEAAAFWEARVEADCLQTVAERAPCRLNASGAADIDQCEVFFLEALSGQPYECFVHSSSPWQLWSLQPAPQMVHL